MKGIFTAAINYFFAVVLQVTVVVVSPTSVGVTWNGIQVVQFNQYSLYGYTVYYRQKRNQSEEGYQSLTVPNNYSNIVIEELMCNAVYEFQVAAIVVRNGEQTMGVRSAAVESHYIYARKLQHKSIVIIRRQN